jgi:hypothetical protein
MWTRAADRKNSAMAISNSAGVNPGPWCALETAVVEAQQS